ncbi:hypothetical protein GXW82_13545 [Streptacidiphilus sp. 4-A2]|nr:hypothetical protein [Streptacidiphilus sp. 4-A2]
MLTLSSWRARFDRLTDTSEVVEQVDGSIVDYLQNRNIGWYLHSGDLIVPENVDNDLALVVDGDMIVHGFLDDYVADTGLLVVLGDLVVRDLVSWGSVYVAGDLRAEGVVYGYYNDYTFEVAGEVHARALVLSDKDSSYRTGEVEAEIDSYCPTDDQYRAAARSSSAGVRRLEEAPPAREAAQTRLPELRARVRPAAQGQAAVQGRGPSGDGAGRTRRGRMTEQGVTLVERVIAAATADPGGGPSSSAATTSPPARG